MLYITSEYRRTRSCVNVESKKAPEGNNGGTFLPAKASQQTYHRLTDIRRTTHNLHTRQCETMLEGPLHFRPTSDTLPTQHLARLELEDKIAHPSFCLNSRQKKAKPERQASSSY